MIRIFAPLLLFFFSSTASFAQDVELLSSFDAQARFIETDNLGFLYLVKNQEIEKYNNYGQLLQRYSDKTFGTITSVDVTNPLKILVFYRDQGVIRMLDNMLAPSGNAIRLNDFGIFMPVTACTSLNNGIWVYDQANFQLHRISDQNDLVFTSGNLAQTARVMPAPVQMQEHSNFVFLADSSAGVFMFDFFGTYYKTLPLQVSEFQALEDHVAFLESGVLVLYNYKSHETFKVALPVAGAASANVQKDRIYLLTGSGVQIYRFSISR